MWFKLKKKKIKYQSSQFYAGMSNLVILGATEIKEKDTKPSGSQQSDDGGKQNRCL